MDSDEELRDDSPISIKNESPTSEEESQFSEKESPEANVKSETDCDELQMWVDDEGEDDVVCTEQDAVVLSISSSSEESLDLDDDETGDEKPSESFTSEGNEGDELHCIIETVFANQSSEQSISSRQNIIRQGHPGISSSLSACCASVSLFRRKPWLTACDRMKKIFCWPCLLFGDKYFWSCCVAKKEFTSIALAVGKHEITAGHVRCLDDLKTMEQSEKEAKERRELCHLLRTTAVCGSPKTTPCDEDLHADSMLIGRLFANKLKNNMSDEFIEKLLAYGRPRPQMKKFLAHYKIKRLPYDTVPWLTASEPMSLLFCWPCLLFISLKNWSYGSSGNYSALEASMNAHENTMTHMLSMMKLKSMEFQIKKSKTEIESAKTKESSDQMVKNIRTILKVTIEAVCCLKKKSTNSKVLVEDYIQLMEFLGCCNHDEEKPDDSEKHENYHSIVTKYLDGILSVMEFFIISEIIKEVSKAHFVSLILEDTSPSLNHSLVAVIIRYVDNSGEIRERFLKFIPLEYNRLPNKILQHVEELTSLFDCEMKLVGFTYDGCVVNPESVFSFNKEFKLLFPLSGFFPYREHDLRRTLIQALSHIPKLRLFFHQLCDMSNFFEDTPNAISTFLGIVYENNAGPEVYNKVWDFSSCFAITLWDYHTDILAVLEKIANNPHEWSSETVIRAFGFTHFLQNSENLSLILATKMILSAIEELPPLLAGPFQPSTWKKTVHAVAVKLSSLKERYTQLSINFVGVTKSICSKQMFHQMLEAAEQFILTRYESLDSLAHIALLENSNEWSADVNIENDWIEKHSSVINPKRLGAQLKFQSANPFFADKTVAEKLKNIYEYDMVEALPELTKFLLLVLSIPLTVDTSSSAVHKLRLYVKENPKLTTVDALLWMEGDLLNRLETEEGFVDRVIDHIL